MSRGLRGVLAGSRGAGGGGAVRACVGRRAPVCGREREGGGGEQLPVDQQRDCGSACTARSSRHECGGEGGPVTSTAAKAAAAGVTIADDPTFEQVVSEFEYTPNMTPVGYSANVIPYLPNPYNSDLAFKGDYAFMGTNDGFVVIDIKDPAKPKQVHLNKSCTTSQGDVVVYGNILVRSWDSATSATGAATQSCGGTLVGQGFEGVHIFDITDPTNPVMVDVGNNPADGKQGLRFSTQDVPRKGCGSHTATAVPAPAHDALYIYNGGSCGTCTWMDVLKIKISDPTQAAYVKQAPSGRSCHDNTVFLNGADSRATLRRRQRHHDVQVRRHDRPDAAGRHREPDPDVVEAAASSGSGHSAAFSYDGKTVVFGHEPGGGVGAELPGLQLGRQQVAVHPERGDQRHDLDGHDAARAAQQRELHVAQLQHRADQGRQLPGVRQLPGRHQRDRLHAAGRAEGHRLRRPEAAAEQRPRTAATASRTAATGRPTGTTARSTRPTSTAASSSGISTTRSPTARTRSRTRTRRRRSARSRPTTSPRRSRRPTRAPATCRARPSRPRSRAPTRAWASTRARPA